MPSRNVLSCFHASGASAIAPLAFFLALAWASPARAEQPGDDLPAAEDSAAYKSCTGFVPRAEDGGWHLPHGSRIVRVVPAGPRRADGSTAFVPGVCVFLPPGYDSGGLRYPVIYGLHGGAGQQGIQFPDLWDEVMGADASKHAIIVGADGAGMSAWFDRFDNNITAIQNLAYREQGAAFGRTLNETYLLHWVLPYIDQHFRTIPKREGRALWGISNGGHGAALLAARQPDLFTAASIQSGNVAWVSLNANQELTFNPETGEYSSAYRAGHLPANLAGNLRDVALMFDIASSCDLADFSDFNFLICPFQNILDQMFLQGNRDMQAALAAAGPRAENDYRETVGGHTDSWWRRWLQERHLPFLLRHLADPQASSASLAQAPPPESFSYRSISPQFSVYGYEIGIERAINEFADFTFSANEITAFGSGKATVLTAPRYRRSTAYRVTDDSGEARTFLSDALGRLRIELDLGPSNQAEYRGYYGDAGGAAAAEAAINRQPGVQRRVSIVGPAADGVHANKSPAPGSGGGALSLIPLLALLLCAGLRKRAGHNS